VNKKKFNKPVYYIHGEESCLLDGFVDDVKKAVLTTGFESMNYHVYYGESLDVTEALTEAKTMPAFSDKRLLVIKDASSLRIGQKEALQDYLLDPSPWSVLVFVSNKKKPGLTGKFASALRAKGEVIFLKSSPSKAGSWIAGEVRACGKVISPEASRRLTGLTGGSLTALKSELEKIILFVGDKKTIELSDVSEAGLDVKADNIFDLTDAIGARDLKKAYYLYEKLSTEHPLMITGAIARQIRVLLNVKTCIRDGLSPKMTASAAKVPPYYLDKYKKSASLFTIKELKRAIGCLFETNLNLKGSGLPEDVIMTDLIMRLCK